MPPEENINKKKSRSALSSHRTLLFLILAITVLDISFSSWAVLTVQKEMTKNAAASIQIHMDQMFQQFSAVNKSLKRVLVEAGTKGELERARSPVTLSRIQARLELIKKFTYVSTEVGSSYTLFYYFPVEHEIMIASASNLIPLTLRDELESALASYSTSPDSSRSTSPSWTLLPIGDLYYAVRIYEYQGVYAGSCIPVEALLSPLKTIYGEDAFPVLLTSEGEAVFGWEQLQEDGLPDDRVNNMKQSFRHNGKRWLVIESASQYLNFQIRLYIRGYSVYEHILIIQVLALIVVAFVLSVVIISMAYIQKKILRPLRAFTDGLKNYDPDAPLLPKLSNEIEELAQTSEQFHNLTKELQRLKIDSYEQKLEKQQIQMDYMQLQIKPHFFLNSLNLIHTMAQYGDTESISALSKSTSEYLRYIFQAGKNLVLLEQELNHIRDFISIMSIRYPERFCCEIVSDAEAEAQLIPPLILQTFVENTLKHGMYQGRRLNVCISAMCDELKNSYGEPETFLTLFVTDNGKGFDEELLKLWEEGLDMAKENGEHIGIANAGRRLQMTYRGAAVMKLYNSPKGGAVVEIRIPVK